MNIPDQGAQVIIFLLIIDALLTLVPFVLTGIYYNSMPENIPLFVNFMGEPAVVTGKTLLTAFRLPVMALILQAVCLAMYLGCREAALANPRTKALQRNFWLAASLTAAIKLFASCVPFTGAIHQDLVPVFRLVAVMAAMLGVAYMLACIVRLYREEGRGLGRIFMPKGKAYAIITAALLVLYAVIVLMKGNGEIKPPMP
jgi:uncharacterized membrane protein